MGTERGGRGHRLCYCTMSQYVIGYAHVAKVKKRKKEKNKDFLALCSSWQILCYGCLDRSDLAFERMFLSAAQVVFVRRVFALVVAGEPDTQASATRSLSPGEKKKKAPRPFCLTYFSLSLSHCKPIFYLSKHYKGCAKRGGPKSGNLAGGWRGLGGYDPGNRPCWLIGCRQHSAPGTWDRVAAPCLVPVFCQGRIVDVDVWKRVCARVCVLKQHGVLLVICPFFSRTRWTEGGGSVCVICERTCRMPPSGYCVCVCVDKTSLSSN